MKIGITLKKNAYTPEAFAYKKFLENNNCVVELDYSLDPNNDINVFFMGVIPFWKKKHMKAIEIHEYQSLSIGAFSKLKDSIKANVNRKPTGRIFLNDTVRSGFNFKDDLPFLKRDMGVDEIFFKHHSKTFNYDIVYAGSINGRCGLINVLIKLAKSKKVVVVGDIDKKDFLILKKSGIHCTGRLNLEEISKIYSQSKYGLNYTPDIYPFNIQTSTKTLEYLAAGLHIISNKYFWAECFFNKIKYDPIWIDEDLENVNFNIENKIIPDMSEYKWENIFSKIGLVDYFNSFLGG